MPQTKIQSVKEQLFRIGINYILSCLSYLFLFPGSDWKVIFLRGLYFIALSFLTGYTIRRLFNRAA